MSHQNLLKLDSLITDLGSSRKVAEVALTFQLKLD